MFNHKLLHYHYEKVLKETEHFFENKSIVLVGPSEQLTTTSLGSKIDSFDHVARMNWQWPVHKDREENYGSRTDILFHACSSSRDLKEQLPNELPEKDKTPKIVFYEYGYKTEELVLWCNKHNIPHYNISSLYYLLRFKTGTYPFTGNVATHMLLDTKLNSLMLYGFNLYQGKTYKEYFSEGNIEFLLKSKNTKKKITKIWKHDLQLSALHLKTLSQDSRINFESEFHKTISPKITTYLIIRKIIMKIIYRLSCLRPKQYNLMKTRVTKST